MTIQAGKEVDHLVDIVLARARLGILGLVQEVQSVSLLSGLSGNLVRLLREVILTRLL